MAERFNGKHPYVRRTHGSDRRGVIPVPRYGNVEQLQQSRRDRQRLLDFRKEWLESKMGMGNPNLPAYQHKEELIANIENYKATIVGGPTGSGKSTQLPQYLYEAGYDMTLVLVPRRVIADGLGERIREEMTPHINDGMKADDLIGIIHGERTERSDENKIMVMTPNTFIKMEQDIRERFGDKKLAIIADEIHEANIFTEIATGIAAMGVKDHEKWRLIAASATHNAETLKRPFQEINEGFVPTVEIEGRPFNVELQEDSGHTPMQVYANQGVEHEKSMIFTSGKKEIDYIISETRAALDKKEPGASSKVIFRKLHGELTERELAHINDPIPEGYRLVIVSSPAGMSGITIPGVTLVVTDGTINRSELDDDGASGLSRRYLSKAGVIQQIGRAGRDVAGGIGIIAKPVQIKSLKQKSDSRTPRTDGADSAQMAFIPFQERKEHEPAEIYHTNLSSVTLSTAAVNQRLYEINNYIPHPVLDSDIINAEEALARIGALDDDDRITEIGRYMSQFPVMPEIARGLYEAAGPHRSIEHMARAAFIGAAIDAGGLQDYSADQEAQRRANGLIRQDVADDFIAQLDIMNALREKEILLERELYDVELHDLGLHAKNVERARKVARKILGVMGINIKNIVPTTPLPHEETRLRNDFTAGFIDLVYEPTGKVSRTKQPLYRNIHGDDESTVRKISDRSVAKPKSDALVAGIPRWYEEYRKKGTLIKHDIIDRTLLVDPSVVGEYATLNGLVRSRFVRPVIRDGIVVDSVHGYFGSIPVDAPVEPPSVEVIPIESQAELARYVQNHPGERLRALRGIANELKRYRNIIPADDYASYLRQDAPKEITKELINELIDSAVAKTRKVYEIDVMLGEYMYSKNISLSRYFDLAIMRKMDARSPTAIDIAGMRKNVYYDQGQPYVSGLTRQQLKQLAKYNTDQFLPDGREILLQREKDGGGVERVKFSLLATETN